MVAGGHRRRVVRLAARARRRRPHRPAPHARLRAAAPPGGRRLAGLRDHDQQRRLGGLPRTARREPAPRDDPGAVHRGRRARRRLDRVPARRAMVSKPSSPVVLLYVAVTMLVAGRDAAGRCGDAAEPRRRPSRRRSIASPARAIGCTASGSGSSGRPGRASRRPSSASAAASSRCRSCIVAMGVPLRVATATSNLMIGITASVERPHLPGPRRDRPVPRRSDGASASSSARRSARGSRTGSTRGSSASCSSRSSATRRSRCWLKAIG